MIEVRLVVDRKKVSDEICADWSGRRKIIVFGFVNRQNGNYGPEEFHGSRETGGLNKGPMVVFPIPENLLDFFQGKDRTISFGKERTNQFQHLSGSHHILPNHIDGR